MACENSDSNTSYSHPRSHSPTLVIHEDEDESMKQLMPLENVKLSTDELSSEFYHHTIFTTSGTIFHFINSSCPGAASIIGALRCNLAEARKIPAYVQRNKNKLKIHAVNALENHFRNSQCAIGAGENLTMDDYGITFALASVTQAGAELNPSRGMRGPSTSASSPISVRPPC